MQKLLLTISAIALMNFANAQCTELFFSEYVEGSHNNKALEIYNPTANTIDLSNYRIIRWSNGSTTSDQDIRYVQSLSGTIPPYGTYVAILDRRDPAGTGVDTILFAELLNYGNTCNAGFYSPCYTCFNGGDRVMPFNGDDAITLDKFNGAGYDIVDIFGLIGERPQTFAGGTVAGWTDTPDYWNGVGAYWTKDQTLIRKYNIGAGVTTNPGIPYGVPGAFNPTLLWDSLPRNTFDSLGFHNCICSPSIVTTCTVTLIDELTNKNKFKVYPNPSSNNQVTITSGKVLKSVEVYNLLGQMVYQSGSIENRKQFVITLNEINSGMYFIAVNFSDGTQTTKRIVIE